MLFYHYLIPLQIQINNVYKDNLPNFNTKLNVFANVFSIVFIMEEFEFSQNYFQILIKFLCENPIRFPGWWGGDTMKHVKDEGEWRDDKSISEPCGNA